MTEECTQISDWVLIEAAKRCEFVNLNPEDLRHKYKHSLIYRALCDMIAKYETEPVDRKLMCAREATKQFESKRPTLGGYVSFDLLEPYVVHAIELYCEGYGE